MARITASLTALLSVALFSVVASAQSGPPVTLQPGPMPGDSPMPTIDFQLSVSAAPSAANAHAQETPAPKPLIPLAVALEGAQAAIDTCAADGYHVGVAVIDPNGNLIVGMNADGAAASRAYTAVRKAITAATFKDKNSALKDKFLADAAMRARITPAMSVFPGAVPILVGDKVLGAVGASGATGFEEEKCAKAGVDKILAKLK
jgi:uncharacterized protein GlcG (DUF336 family)